MIIGIDFDGVLTDLSGFFYEEGEKYAAKNNIKIVRNEDAHSTLDYFGWTIEDDIDFWETNNLKYTKFVSSKPGAEEILKRFHDEGHKIIIVTARYECDLDTEKGKAKREISEGWLKEHGIVYDKIFYIGSKSKVKTILKNKIDIFIDDSVKNLAEISKVIPVICFHEKYNRNYHNPNMIRLASWNEIYDYINKISDRDKDVEDIENG